MTDEVKHIQIVYPTVEEKLKEMTDRVFALEAEIQEKDKQLAKIETKKTLSSSKKKEKMTEDTFKFFIAQRTRFVPCEKVTLKELYKAFNRWSVTSRELFQDRKKISLEAFKQLCEDHLGDSRGLFEYNHLRVFLDEEDVEEYDIHPENPYTAAIPAEIVADHILKSDNKKALIIGLIEDKRGWSSEIDRLEAENAKLEDCIKRKTEYVEKLLNKIALLYVSLPEDKKPQTQ